MVSLLRLAMLVVNYIIVNRKNVCIQFLQT